MKKQGVAAETVPLYEAAARLGVDHRTLRRAVVNKEVPGITLGKVVMIPTRWLDRVLSGEVDAAPHTAA